jgi:hypothetical protein
MARLHVTCVTWQKRCCCNLEYDKLDIADSDALFERYGTVIPVLARGDGRELGWPFGAAELQEFISS